MLRPEEAAVAIPPPDEGQPEPPSRRSMLLGAASAGVAGFALTALAGSPALAATRQSDSADRRSEQVPDSIADGDAVVAHVRDVRSGEIDVYRGTTHVRVLDRALAAQLARASR